MANKTNSVVTMRLRELEPFFADARCVKNKCVDFNHRYCSQILSMEYFVEYVNRKKKKKMTICVVWLVSMPEA